MDLHPLLVHSPPPTTHHPCTICWRLQFDSSLQSHHFPSCAPPPPPKSKRIHVLDASLLLMFDFGVKKCVLYMRRYGRRQKFPRPNFSSFAAPRAKVSTFGVSSLEPLPGCFIPKMGTSGALY